MFDMKSYWDNRYSEGGTSGDGSYGENCNIKADYVNNVLDMYRLCTIKDMGFGDGNQLVTFTCDSYVGYDISDVVVDRIKYEFKDDDTKEFYHMRDYVNNVVDLTLSLEVIFHLVNDNDYDEYMNRLLESHSKYVLIYTMNGYDKTRIADHVIIRDVVSWVENSDFNNWSLVDDTFGFGTSHFYLYKNKDI